MRTPFSARGFTCYSLAPEDLLLVGADRLLGPLPGQVPLTRAAELPLIVYRRWAGVLDQAFASRGLRARFLCIADDARTCISWARLGLGVAVAPADILIAGGAGDLQTRVLRGLSPAAATTLAVRESGCDTAVGRAFVSYFLGMPSAGEVPLLFLPFCLMRRLQNGMLRKKSGSGRYPACPDPLQRGR